mgnify:CR=1 FL=1
MLIIFRYKSRRYDILTGTSGVPAYIGGSTRPLYIALPIRFLIIGIMILTWFLLRKRYEYRHRQPFARQSPSKNVFPDFQVILWHSEFPSYAVWLCEYCLLLQITKCIIFILYRYYITNGRFMKREYSNLSFHWKIIQIQKTFRSNLKKLLKTFTPMNGFSHNSLHILVAHRIESLFCRKAIPLIQTMGILLRMHVVASVKLWLRMYLKIQPPITP